MWLQKQQSIRLHPKGQRRKRQRFPLRQNQTIETTAGMILKNKLQQWQLLLLDMECQHQIIQTKNNAGAVMPYICKRQAGCFFYVFVLKGCLPYP